MTNFAQEIRELKSMNSLDFVTEIADSETTSQAALKSFEPNSPVSNNNYQ